MEEYITVIKKYATFTGRARRKEYWMFVLFSFIISLVLSFVDKAIGLELYQNGGMIGTIYSVFVFIPSIAVSVRRLHDIGKSGWVLLIFYAPIILFYAYLFIVLMDVNRFNKPDSSSLMILGFGGLAMLGLGIWMLVLFVTAGDEGKNEYGNDPKGKDEYELTDHLV